MNVHKAGAFLGVLSVFLYGYTLPGVTLNLCSYMTQQGVR